MQFWGVSIFCIFQVPYEKRIVPFDAARFPWPEAANLKINLGKKSVTVTIYTSMVDITTKLIIVVMGKGWGQDSFAWLTNQLLFEHCYCFV